MRRNMTGILWQTLARKRLGTALVLCIVAAFAMLPAAALAAAPLALDAPENGNEPLVAFDPVSGTMYVAWGDPEAGRSAVDLCVLPASASGCEGGAPVLLEDSHYTGDEFAGPGGLVVLPGGRVAVIGDTTVHGSIAWVSPVDGSAFLTGGQGLQNGGLPISPVSLFYAFGNAVALNGTDVGLLDDYAGFFGDTPLTTTDPAIPVANSNQTHPEGLFSRKSLETDGPEIAAEPAPAPAPVGTDIVVGVGDNFAGPTGALPGCLNKEGTGYGVSPGLVDGASNGAGTLNAEGLPGYGVLACSAQAPVLASGGQDGIGLVQEEGPGLDGAGTTITLDFRPFIATATGGSFGAPVQLADVTNQSLGGVNNLDLSDDSATGVYATWSDDQGVVLDYSSDGGATWGVPVVVPAPANGGQGHQVVVGIAGGVAEIAYDGNPGTGDQVFLQFADYHALAAAQASPPPSATPAPDTVVTSQSLGHEQQRVADDPRGDDRRERPRDHRRHERRRRLRHDDLRPVLKAGVRSCQSGVQRRHARRQRRRRGRIGPGHRGAHPGHLLLAGELQRRRQQRAQRERLRRGGADRHPGRHDRRRRHQHRHDGDGHDHLRFDTVHGDAHDHRHRRGRLEGQRGAAQEARARKGADDRRRHIHDSHQGATEAHGASDTGGQAVAGTRARAPRRARSPLREDARWAGDGFADGCHQHGQAPAQEVSRGAALRAPVCRRRLGGRGTATNR